MRSNTGRGRAMRHTIAWWLIRSKNEETYCESDYLVAGGVLRGAGDVPSGYSGGGDELDAQGVEDEAMIIVNGYTKFVHRSTGFKYYKANLEKGKFMRYSRRKFLQ